jgi:polyisoprenoid-binding protein YceI
MSLRPNNGMTSIFLHSATHLCARARGIGSLFAVSLLAATVGAAPVTTGASAAPAASAASVAASAPSAPAVPAAASMLAGSAAAAAAAVPAAPAPAAGPLLLDVVAGRSALDYRIVHKLHVVDARSRQVEGRLAMAPDGKVQFAIRSLVKSFDSSNSSRDSHMQETMEAASFPYVIFKGAAAITVPTAYPAKLSVQVEGELDFHGRKRRETIPVEVTFASATEVHATSTFNVSLDAYAVERPSLLFMKIDDTCRVSADLWLAAGKGG